MAPSDDDEATGTLGRFDARGMRASLGFDGVWTSDWPGLAATLNLGFRPGRDASGGSGWPGYREFHEAAAACGADVTFLAPVPGVPGRIY